MPINASRADEWMEQYDLDVLIATSIVNVTYFTDYSTWTDPLFRQYMIDPGGSSSITQLFAVYPRGGRPILIVNPVHLVNTLDLSGIDIETFASYGPDDSLEPSGLIGREKMIHEMTHRLDPPASPCDALAYCLKSRGLANARIGLEKEGLTPESSEHLESDPAGARMKDASNLIRMIRMVKSEEEIDRLTRAALIGEKAGMEALSLAGPGCAIRDMLRHYLVEISRAGAVLDHFAWGINGQGIATNVDYQLKDNDVLFFDWGCNYRHYFSDTGTTLVVGEMPGPLKERHDALVRCVEAAGSEMKPGVPGSRVQKRMTDEMDSAGLTNSFPHGHGLGLEIRDYPIIIKRNGKRIRDDCIDLDSDLPLEDGMAINLEAAYFVPGVGSVHLERNFLVTDSGCRDLIEHDRSRSVFC
jgi:Xaa-Pro dipeptidase